MRRDEDAEDEKAGGTVYHVFRKDGGRRETNKLGVDNSRTHSWL